MDAAYKRLTRQAVMPPWALHVPLFPDELFSTWLVRVSLAQGCDPMDLTGSLWPRWRAWTVDLDRGLRADRLEILANRSSLTKSQLDAATLLPVVAAITKNFDPARPTWPWVLSQGSRNRRRQGGLQFCPLCIKKDLVPYFRKTWRLAWHVGCVEHRILLNDHCPACQSPLEPHRIHAVDRTICRCPNCSNDLRNSTAVPIDADVLQFQVTADKVLEVGHGEWAGMTVDRMTWFGLAAKHAGKKIRVREDDKTPSGVTSLALNLQRPSERILRLRMANRSRNAEQCGKLLSDNQDAVSERRESRDGDKPVNPSGHQTPPARPKIKVQGDWIRLLRRLRIGHQ